MKELKTIYKGYQKDNRRFTYKYSTMLSKPDEIDMKISFSRIYHKNKTQYVITIKLPYRKVLLPDLTTQIIPHKHTFKYCNYREAKNKLTEYLNFYGIRTNKQKTIPKIYVKHEDCLAFHRVSFRLYDDFIKQLGI